MVFRININMTIEINIFILKILKELYAIEKIFKASTGVISASRQNRFRNGQR